MDRLDTEIDTALDACEAEPSLVETRANWEGQQRAYAAFTRANDRRWKGVMPCSSIPRRCVAVA